jgi:hypothetical protein
MDIWAMCDVNNTPTESGEVVTRAEASAIRFGAVRRMTFKVVSPRRPATRHNRDCNLSQAPSTGLLSNNSSWSMKCRLRCSALSQALHYS